MRKIIPSLAVLIVLAGFWPAPICLAAAPEEGIALAIIYDTSGSMKENVRDKNGSPSPKYVIANRALISIAQQLQTYTTNSATGASRRIDAGLFIFSGEGVRQAIPFGPFRASAFESWARSFSNPNGGTPLGNALSTASHVVLASPLTRKHVLIITDGANTVGPTPAAVMPALKKEAGEKQTGLSVHFVAFDVDAREFNGVKQLGATVVGAADEKQLTTQLGFIMQQKILLEEEEPAKKK